MEINLDHSVFVVNVTISTVIAVSIGAISIALTIKFALGGSFWKWFSGVWKWANKQYAKTSIRQTLKKIKCDPSLIGLDGEKRTIKLEFAEDLKYDDINENEVVLIALDSHKNTPRNVTVATIQYISKEFLPQSSVTLTPNIEKSLCLSLARETFKTNKMVEAQQYFHRQLLPSEYKSDPNLEILMKDMQQISEMGLLSRVLLRQFFELNQLTFDTVNYSEIKKETEEFVSFIHKIATRDEYSSTPIKFFKKYLKVRIFLVTSSSKAQDGAVGLVKRINAQDEAEYVYLICPAINRLMVDRPHLPSWKIYKETLKLIQNTPSRFSIAKTQEFFVKGKVSEIKVGVSFLIRN